MSESFSARLIFCMLGYFRLGRLARSCSELLCGLAPLRENLSHAKTQSSQRTKTQKGHQLIGNAHPPKPECIIKRSLAESVVASGRAAVARAQVHFQNQRI